MKNFRYERRASWYSSKAARERRMKLKVRTRVVSGMCDSRIDVMTNCKGPGQIFFGIGLSCCRSTLEMFGARYVSQIGCRSLAALSLSLRLPIRDLASTWSLSVHASAERDDPLVLPLRRAAQRLLCFRIPP